MERGRFRRYFLAAVVILTALFAAPQAEAHSGSHAQMRPHGVAGKAMSKGVVRAIPSVSSPAVPQMAQCGAMICWGGTCSSGGFVIASASFLPLPAHSGSTVLPEDTPSSSGRDAEGLRRPPRA
jgi:hypothetical protein